MHREKLLALLDRYERSGRLTEEERPSLARMRAFVMRRSDCFERALIEGHITGSAWLSSHDGSACLLVHHRKLGRWLQAGGHADGDPDVLEVALREAREESGIEGVLTVSPEVFDVDVHAIPGTSKEQAHDHYDVRFLLRAPPDATLLVSEESHAVAWVPRADVPAYTRDASVARMARKWTI